MTDEITLKSGRKIGVGHPTYIVAEVGSNWTSLEDCRRSIGQAKCAGADAVKFQAYDAQALYGFTHEGAVKAIGTLPPEWLPHLKEKADACGIDFMCTAFSPELVDAVNPFVEIHKVASAECTHVRILEKVRDIGKPVFLSTGAHGRPDIGQAVTSLRPRLDQPVAHVTPVVLLYCVAAYPARNIDMRHLFALRSAFDKLVGYSDHTTDYGVIPLAAQAAGAVVIEKHFTAIEADTPDRPHSLTVDEFKTMVHTLRGTKEFVWGSGEELPMLTTHNRRLIATRDIGLGEPFQENGNFGIYRSLKPEISALSPWAVGHVQGKAAKRDIRAGEGISPGDF